MSEIEQLRPRIVGTELEFGVAFELRGGYRHLTSPYKLLLNNIPTNVISHRNNPTSNDYFLENGGRYYLDMRHHWEYATPECATFADAVTYDIAGEDFICDHFSSPLAQEIFENAGIFKKVSDHSEGQTQTAGAHENYHTDRINLGFEYNRKKSLFVAGLASHLITRSVFTGAGSVDADGVFHKTQKLRTLTRTQSGSTTSDKPIVNTRIESLAEGEHERVHIISGDPNISPWAGWMKLGTTSLVLRLLEHSSFPIEAVIANERMVEAAVAIGSTAALDTLVVIEGGKSATALDVQEIVFDAAEELGRKYELPPEEYAVLGEWEAVIQDLRQDPERCMDRIDWLSCRYVIESAVNAEERKKRDLGYTMLYPGGGFGLKLRDRSRFKMTPTREEIVRARTTPPADTRAVLRGEAIRQFKMNNVNGVIGWDFARNDTKPKKIARIMFNDPYDHDVSRLNKWLKATLS